MVVLLEWSVQDTKKKMGLFSGIYKTVENLEEPIYETKR